MRGQATWVVGYTAAGLAWKPRALVEYNFASGDSDPSDGQRGTFDQLYPTGHDKYGLADQVGWRNIRHLRSGVEFKPAAKLSLAAMYHSYWLANARDGLYGAAGALLVRKADGSAGTRVGQEIDISGTYSMNKQVQIGAGLGHLFAGSFLKQATRDGHSYTFPYVMLGFTF